MLGFLGFGLGFHVSGFWAYLGFEDSGGPMGRLAWVPSNVLFRRFLSRFVRDFKEFSDVTFLGDKPNIAP